MRSVPRRVVLVPLVALLFVAPAGAKPEPVTGKQAVVERVSGRVTVTPKGSSRAVKLARARPLPFGSTIDASGGSVKIVTTKDARHNQSGTFSKGAFTLTQTKGRRPLTDLRLVGGDFSACPPAAGGRLVGATSARRRPVRRLFGRAHGRFRTRGRNSSATVRGTVWSTEDTCEGTATVDHEGRVLAKGDQLSYDLEPGQTVQILCDPDGQEPVSSLFCLAVLSEPAKNIFAFGIATTSPGQTQFDLCITNPDTTVKCDTYPFQPPDENGFLVQGIGCIPGGGPGDYAVRFSLSGTELAVPLPFTSTMPLDPNPFCVRADE